MVFKNFPFPPSDKCGWPWQEESRELPLHQSNGDSWPKISIVTPCFNHVRFLEETIRSVLLQNYPNLEYIVIDGGSTDGSVEIIRKYEQWITYWQSKPDKGQTDAINKGFLMATGQYCNFINSDDVLCKDAFYYLALKEYLNTSSLIIGQPWVINEHSEVIQKREYSGINSLADLLDLQRYWRNSYRDSIFQQATLYPLEVVREIGKLGVSNHYTMDYELFGKLLDSGIEIRKVNNPIGMFRIYQGQKTSFENAATRELVRNALNILKKSNLDELQKSDIERKIKTYWRKFRFCQLRSRIGVKRKWGFLIKIFFER